MPRKVNRRKEIQKANRVKALEKRIDALPYRERLLARKKMQQGLDPFAAPASQSQNLTEGDMAFLLRMGIA